MSSHDLLKTKITFPPYTHLRIYGLFTHFQSKHLVSIFMPGLACTTTTCVAPPVTLPYYYTASISLQILAQLFNTCVMRYSVKILYLRTKYLFFQITLFSFSLRICLSRYVFVSSISFPPRWYLCSSLLCASYAI